MTPYQKGYQEGLARSIEHIEALEKMIAGRIAQVEPGEQRLWRVSTITCVEIRKILIQLHADWPTLGSPMISFPPSFN